MESRYKISKDYSAGKYCSYTGEWYLLEVEDGKTLKQLAEPHYNILTMLMDYSSLLELTQKKENKDGE